MYKRQDEVDCHEEHNDAEGNEKPIWQAALRHTLEIFVFIFAFSLVFGMIAVSYTHLINWKQGCCTKPRAAALFLRMVFL